jgi:hypothetical protein
MSDKPTRIENLSDELFLDLFSFIQPKDLLQVWYNLNSRINAILRSVYITIEIKNDNDFNDSLSILKHFRSQIIYLKDDRLFSPDTGIDVRDLINIRFLYLSHCSNEQSQYIHSDNLPHLTRFSSSSLPWSFYERILFGSARFPHLMSIGCPRGASILLLNETHSINTTIRHLHLHSASCETLHKFIAYIPNVTVLIIDYLYGSQSPSPVFFIKSSIHRLVITHILSSQFYFDELILCLGLSNLTHIRVIFDTCDFQQLARILAKLPRLKHFNLRVKTYSPSLELGLIRLISPWFLSLDYEQFADQHQNQRAPLIINSRKQSN